MAKEKFLLVSLSENKAKQLAQAISNETCRKILDYLADKEATESELSEKLNIPISTVHYNLQQLQKGNLVVADEYHYSEKGKEVNHYKLANKYIIIAPKSTYGIKEKLKSVLPVALIVAAGTAFIQYFTKTTAKFAAVQEAAPRMLAEESADTAAGVASTAVETVPVVADKFPLYSNIALWFFIGAASTIVLYLLIDWFRNRKN
ncbi:helix-turn-helix domain-containing protein [Candidatus Woesearchaeota archaeon]|nr:helix-turn-helix domain-containing protein [Candidatus Woesearchaeota archaeon]